MPSTLSQQLPRESMAKCAKSVGEILLPEGVTFSSACFSRDAHPEDSTDSFLRKRVDEGVVRRYGPKRDAGLLERAKKQVEHELALIARLGFVGYFLIVWDIVQFVLSHLTGRCPELFQTKQVPWYVATDEEVPL